MSFYTLTVTRNQEDKIKETLIRKTKIEGLEDVIGRVYAPSEKFKSVKHGETKESYRKIYPGYIFVEINALSDQIPERVWFLIKEIRGVYNFISTGGRQAIPMSKNDEEKMLKAVEQAEDKVNFNANFLKGDRVRVTTGAFMNFEGTVDSIVQEKGIINIVTQIFGRSTSLELESWQIEKVVN